MTNHDTIATLDLERVVGGNARPQPLQAKPSAKLHAKPKVNDHGKAAFMKIWNQIAEQQSGGYR